MNDTIVRNSATCLTCGDRLESRHRHDFQSCACGAVSVDGGTEYLRRLVADGAAFEDTSILAPEEDRTHRLEHSEQEVHGVHHSALCAGRPCTVHRRSDHALRGWPQVWVDRPGGRIMRMCPHNGLHRDPDEPGRKGCDRPCDGCCRSAGGDGDGGRR